MTIRPDTDSWANFANALRYAQEQGLDYRIVAEVLAVYQEWLLKAPNQSEPVQVTGIVPFADTGKPEWTEEKATLFAIFRNAGRFVVNARSEALPCAVCGGPTDF